MIDNTTDARDCEECGIELEDGDVDLCVDCLRDAEDERRALEREYERSIR